MKFKQAEKRFKQLEDQFAAGSLSEDDFKAQLENLMFQDEQGHWWVIGYETKKWYRYNGKEWVQDIPQRQLLTTNTIITLAVIGVFVVLGVWGVASSLKSSTTGETGPSGPAGPAGPTGIPGEPGQAATTSELSCTECHNDTAIITGKRTPWQTSLHGSGENTEYAGGRDGCAGCHSGASFSKMVAAGQTPETFDGNVIDVTHQDCRTCHQIHTTFTSDDWALETTNPVALYAIIDATYDGGAGNLCANCHQPRRQIDEPVNGLIDVTSTHWGPHHGPHSALLLGVGGAGDVEGIPAAHYTMIENTCVSCHMGENDDHSFEPSVTACQACHADAESFDINGVQTDVQERLNELEEALIANGMLIIGTDGDEPVVGSYPEAEAQALWNYIFIAIEDSSLGVHNPTYTRALLDWSIEALK